MYTAGIDDADSECALDGRQWDVIFENDEAVPRQLWATKLLELERKIMGQHKVGV